MAELAKTPLEVGDLFVARVKEGDVEGLMELYDPDATFAVDADTIASGAAIREAVEGFAALKPTMNNRVDWVQEAGDVALVLNHWNMEAIGPDGLRISNSGRAADVLRRGADGGWRFAIDFPLLGSIE